jgi:uncharacterized protein (DUF362 family)/NAD-dependent dihydropyrimidine dehydrogenase PreA subunit
MEKVAVIRCASYDLGELDSAVKSGLNTIKFSLPENKKVLIKPNIMSQNRPKQHTITHFALVEVLCSLLRENNCDVLIGDSISFYEEGLTWKAFQTSMLHMVAQRTGAELIPFEEIPLKKIDVNFKVLKEIYIPEILFDVDMVINVCKLKTHSTMRLSGAIKNIFGCLPGGYKQLIHQWSSNEFELAAVFIKLHQLIKPELSIMDAVISLDGGPTAIGKKVKTNQLLFSKNPAALDYVAARMIGYQPEKLPILIEAQKKNLISDYTKVEILGELKINSFNKLINQKLNRKLNPNSMFVKHTYVDLFVQFNKCTECNKCMNHCPVQAIIENSNMILIDNEKCIHCYGCLLICPEKAIRTRKKPINLMIRGIRRIIKI